jgi:O-antigen ligase
MNADVAVLRPKVPEAVWPVLAMVFGVIGGLAAVRDIQSLLIVALAGLVFVAAVFRRIEVGLFALLLTLPLDIYGRVISGPIPLTVFQIVLAATLVAWFARIFTDARQWCRLSVMDMSVLVLVVAAFVSITFSAVPGDTLYAAVRVVFLWLFMLLVENGIRTEQRLERYFDLLIVTAVFFGLFGIAQQYVPGFDFGSTHQTLAADGSVDLSRAAGLFEDPNMFAGYLSVCFAAAFAFAVHAQTRKRILVFLAATAVIGVGLLATFSRTGWVGALVGGVVVALTAPKKRRSRIIGAGIALVLAATLVAPGQVAERAVSIFDVERDLSNVTRYGMYVSTVEMIADDWVGGTGLGAFEHVYPEYRQPGTILSVRRPHQLPIAFWAEMGVLGLVAEILLVGALAALFWPRRGRPWTVFEAASLAGLLTLLSETFFQYYLYFEYLWLFVALCVVSSRLARTGVKGVEERG